MQVIFQNFNYTNNFKPSFKSMGFTFGTYRDCFGINRETQNPTALRKDINFDDFADITKLRFRNFDTVNIMPMCVSDGMEAYLFSNAIIRKFVDNYTDSNGLIDVGAFDGFLTR